MMFNLRLNHRKSKLFLLIPLLLMAASTAVGQTNTFTYQGRLTDGGTPATGIYDMQFKLYDAPTGGSQQPPAPGGPTTITNATVTVTNGIFTVQLDFGSGAFPGGPSPTGDRYLEIAMRHPNDAAYTTLSPRQQITSTPYAIRSSSAQAADNATQLATQLSSPGTINTSSNPVDWTELKNVPSFVNGGYSAGNGISITGTTLSNTGVLTVDASGPLSSSGGQNPSLSLSGLVPVVNGGTGSATQNFVDLSTNQSIAGNKTFTSAVNTSTQYNIGGNRVLSESGADGNLFAGFEAGQSNSTGIGNSFFGKDAGFINTTGGDNSFFGKDAGSNNIDGSFNSFFGWAAGSSNRTINSVSGNNNSFFGREAGQSNTTGSNNVAVGGSAGSSNTSENNNSFIGSSADGAPGITNATAIGFRARVTQSNSVVLGSINGINGATADTNVGIGTPMPLFPLTVNGVINSMTGGFRFPDGTTQTTAAAGGGGVSGTGTANMLPLWTGATTLGNSVIVQLNNQIGIGISNPSSLLDVAGNINTSTQYNIGGHRVLSVGGASNVFVGNGAGQLNTGNTNSFFGTLAGATNMTGSANTFIGDSAGFSNTTGNSNVAVGSIAGSSMSDGNSNNIYIASRGANESKTIRIGDSNQTQTFIAGINGVNVGAAAQVFVNANGQLGTVASSRRFKENIRDMGANSSDLLRLRPVTFLYKPEYSQGPRTLQYGLIAEEVARVNPNLVAYAKDGTPYTVQYHLLTPMLLNEVQKQDRQLHTQELQLNAQTRQINIQAQQVKAQAQQLADLTARLARVEAQQAHRRYRRQQPKRSRL